MLVVDLTQIIVDSPCLGWVMILKNYLKKIKGNMEQGTTPKNIFFIGFSCSLSKKFRKLKFNYFWFQKIPIFQQKHIEV